MTSWWLFDGGTISSASLRNDTVEHMTIVRFMTNFVELIQWSNKKMPESTLQIGIVQSRTDKRTFAFG